MNTHLHKSWFIILCFFAISHYVLGQSTRSFTYGGSKGKSNGGKVKVEYLLENNGRRQELPSDVINLNNYSKDVKLIVHFSGLEVGLNKVGTKPKNSDHHRRYYLRVTHQVSNSLRPLGSKTKKIGTKIANYGELKNQLVYDFSTITTRHNEKLKIKTEIVDANNGETWNAVQINKSLTLLPRNSDIANKEWRKIKKMWEEVNENPIAENKEYFLEKCEEYLQNCENEVFPCYDENGEETLFYMIRITEDDQQEDYIKEYDQKYPKGRYKTEIERIIKEKIVIEPEIPIEPGARLDFDANYLVINNIKGGKMPYRLKFFNNKDRDSLLHSSYSFSKAHDHINLELLNVSEGTYTVVVADSQEKEFVEKSGVQIRKAFTIDPSIRLTGILLLLGGVVIAYRKYVHF